MSKQNLHKPTLIMLYGYPGAGKTYLSRQLSNEVNVAHVQADRIRDELFEKPLYDKQENSVVSHLVDYMTEEFLEAGISVIYDTNAMRLTQRKALREMARKCRAQFVTIWIQVDPDSAFYRTTKRDKRKSDDKFSRVYDRGNFDKYCSYMQNPVATEDYLVVSGKHTYVSQKSKIMKRLYDIGSMKSDAVTSVVGRPSLINLVPQMHAGRVDQSRRNIMIR